MASLRGASSWLLEASGHDAYERYIVPAWMGGWAEDLVAAADLAPGQRVLDIACGTGIVARKAASLVGPAGTVTGFDADRNMLRYAARYAAGEGVGDIDWQAGDVARLPFSDRAYDAIFCQQGLQFFPDRPGAVAEMHRVLATDGRVAVSAWRAMERIPLFVILAEILGNYLALDATAIFHASCSLSDRETLRGLFAKAGFRDIHVHVAVKVARYPDVLAFLPGYLSVFPVASAIAAMEDADRTDMWRCMVASLDAFLDDDGLAVPMESHVLTARK